MNDRIKALLLNERNMFVNGVTESDNKIYIHGSEENLEKFAELIVKECANMAKSFHHHQYDFTGNLELHEFIKTHFGVE